jgi:uncharacterized protein involved in exopolysaccharide biosynthesis
MIENESEGVVTLSTLIERIWTAKLLVLSSVAVALLMSIIYIEHRIDTYRSETVLSSGQAKSAMPSGFGTLARFAGLNINAEIKGKENLALELLKSRAFLIGFLNRYNYVHDVVAGVGFDTDTGRLIYDESQYNSKSQEWVVKNGKSAKPSDEAVYQKALSVLDVSKNKSSGFVTVSIETVSPKLSKDILNDLCGYLNNYVRDRDIREHQETVQYLTMRLPEISNQEVRSVFFKLLEDAVQAEMLASVNSSYVFSIVDPPFLPEQSLGMSKVVILFLGTVAGALFAIVVIVGREFVFPMLKEHIV